jgi:hypothetical protein
MSPIFIGIQERKDTGLRIKDTGREDLTRQKPEVGLLDSRLLILTSGF